MARGCGIAQNDIEKATNFLTAVGSVIWFNEPGLSDAVFLNGTWLTEVFSSVVSAKHDPRFGGGGTIKSGTFLDL